MIDSNSKTNHTPQFQVPNIWILTSILIAILVPITSLFGIFYKKTYEQETHNWEIQGQAQDISNLIVLIAFLVAIYFVYHHSIQSYLVWLGILSYYIYAFVIYSFAVHFQFLFLFYTTILGLSLYTLIGGITCVDQQVLVDNIKLNMTNKKISNFLLIVAILFAFLWLSEIIPSMINNDTPQELIDTGLISNPVHILDLSFVLPAMFIVSMMIKHEKPLGYILGIPLVVFSITTGIGILMIFILSAIDGSETSIPAAIMISIIIVIGCILTYQYMKDNYTKG